MTDILKSFDTQKTLNPLVWTNTDINDFANIKLNPEIRQKLFSAAKLFINDIKLQNIHIKDVILTGSLANYNWSEYSDIDLHIVVDKSKINVDPDTLEDYFTVKKDQFNTRHNIKIKNFDVEVYVQDVNEEHTASGTYSIAFNKWINKPTNTNVSIDQNAVKKKVAGFISKIHSISEMIEDEEDPLDIITHINNLKEKIKKYRKTGLVKGGEYADENIVFKYLRRSNYLEKLSDMKLQTIDRMLSLQELA